MVVLGMQDLVAAAAQPGSELEVRNVGLNPTRTGILKVLTRMGARVEEIVFQGATSRLVLAAGADLRLVALVANESALRSAFAVGDSVACALHPEDLVVVGWE